MQVRESTTIATLADLRVDRVAQEQSHATHAAHLEAGCNVLLLAMLNAAQRAGSDDA